jgi:hypothetical protein
VAPADSADAHDLLSAARDLIRTDSSATSGIWPRGAAILARQAIESSLDELWTLRSPGMKDTTCRCQLLCLGDFLHDKELSGRVNVTWDGLSRACHIRVYELAPAVEELQAWLECAWELADAVERGKA